MLTKVVSNVCQTPNKPSHNRLKLLKYCQNGKISPNLVTLDGTTKIYPDIEDVFGVKMPIAKVVHSKNNYNNNHFQVQFCSYVMPHNTHLLCNRKHNSKADLFYFFKFSCFAFV